MHPPLKKYTSLKLWQKFLCWCIFIILFIAIGIAIPLSKGDGVERYTGGERKLAVSAMESARWAKVFPPRVPFSYLKASVEEISMRCTRDSDDHTPLDAPGCSPSCYVRVVGWTIFGIQSYQMIYSAGTNLGGSGDCHDRYKYR
jgi:hypothetical protein